MSDNIEFIKYEAVIEDIEDDYLENNILPDLLRNNKYVQVRNQVQSGDLFEAKLIQEVKEKEEYEILQKRDTELDGIITNLGIGSLQNHHVKKTASILEKWGINIDAINKSNILACASKYFTNESENFIKNYELENIKKICENKTLQVSKTASELENTANAVKNALDDKVRRSNINFLRGYNNNFVPKDDENVVFTHEKIKELVEKVEKKREELRKLKEIREKYPLDPDKNVAKEELKRILEELKKKKKMIGNSVSTD